MANVHAIYAVGTSLVTYLRNTYPPAMAAATPCDFRLVSSGEMLDTGAFAPAITLFLYRVTVNEHVRNVPRRHDPSDAGVPLSLDLHYLVTAWADNALTEHTILAWTMRQLHLHQTLSSSDLTPDGGFRADEVIQLVPADLGHEDMTRIWDALDPAYRLSVSYIARVVRIDVDAVSGRPVVARRFDVSGEGADG